ncbi:unnamed protein product [Mytilus coruscus]|uniref:Uncharacterized protein n=1 Tax=Mytilus coruscus TaxID=42192 RepID=A0A6J8AN52_MYTCO|nr:unnamed protein product [Mytilus coruscus]
MSLNKLHKQLSKPEISPTNTRAYTPVLLSDSKGIKLKNKVFSDHPVTQHIHWWCKGGETFQNRYDWLKANLSSKLTTTGNIWLYVWLGTCNLTQKDGRYISLRSTDNSTVDKCVEYIQKIINLKKEHPSCKITILEIPIYSISKYNKSLRHPSPEQFESQDKQLEEQVHTLNSYIRNINSALGVYSLQFSTDIQNHRKVKAHKHPENRNYYNFELYSDGLHPGHTLARYWLRKISNQMSRDCWK